MERFRNAMPLAALVLLTAGLTALPAAAAAADGGEKIIVKKFVLEDCEGDECDEASAHRVVVVGDDGEVREMVGKGTHWLGHGGPHHGFAHHGGKGGFLGVATSELTPELRRHFGVPEEAGVLVAKVVDDSAAAAAGILVGDILTAVDGEELRSSGDLIRRIRQHEPGAAVDVELWRDGFVQTAGVTLGERRAARRHAMLHHCDAGDEDCLQIAALHDFDCGGEDPCEVRIECRDGGCDCTVNGEAADCDSVPGFVAPDD